ncbi:hypothetical protein EW026_g7591 [Hermanssonia centrifuga]|uniref:Cytochrome P450 n=1 Tax=Hermanssonia centrifuga TaxID=98765 RepID=A0A4S4KBQ8_9APHY|nr:hypothetical protein EW026_g7591 [Hermanssonia centrifuga]
MTATIVVGISYGKEILNMEDEYIHLVQTALEGIIQTKRPGAFWMDYFPILKHIPAWVPGATGRKLAERYVPVVRAMRDQPFYSAKDDVSLITTLVFFLAMALRPDVQKKAQAELDNVLGPGKLPTFEDRESLPYVEAIILESIRWMPAVPLGVSHRVLVEDEYKGYRIPKGSIIIPNSWAMLHNAEDYPSPEEFNPDRFIANGALDPDVLDPSLIAFGFGRRVCPGRYLAKDILYLTVASILYVYDIFPAADKMGNPVKLSSEQKTGFLS